MSNISLFFSKEQNSFLLKKFKAKIDAIYTEEPFEMARNSHIKTIINSMAISPEQWDRSCEININWIGDSFISEISTDLYNQPKEILDNIFSSCFRFLLELYLSIKNELAIEFERARKFAFENIDLFESRAKVEIEYAIKDMPISILKSIYNSEDIDSIKNFNKISLAAKAKKEEWDKELDERERRVKILETELSKYEIGFNFVGLYAGFDELSKDKKAEKINLSFWLKVMGCLILLPLITEVIFIYTNIDLLIKNLNLLSLAAIPIISIVAILIYYFRVILHNYNSIKSELLQIELRKTLCRFIQHYSDYAKKMREGDKASLEKFENIIFSGIVSDSEKLPSTYDGFESIGKMLGAVKKQ